MTGIRHAFQKVKEDIYHLKNVVYDWIMFFNQKQNDVEKKVVELEYRLKMLEEKR